MGRHPDPLGRTIELSDTTWYGHIVKGHPEMRGLRPAVEAAIPRPTAIHLSTSDAACRLFYVPSTQTGLMICVVADVEAGLGKTAYLCRRIKPGAREWPSPKPSKEPPGRSGSTTI